MKQRIIINTEWSRQAIGDLIQNRCPPIIGSVQKVDYFGFSYRQDEEVTFESAALLEIGEDMWLLVRQSNAR